MDCCGGGWLGYEFFFGGILVGLCFGCLLGWIGWYFLVNVFVECCSLELFVWFFWFGFLGFGFVVVCWLVVGFGVLFVWYVVWECWFDDWFYGQFGCDWVVIVVGWIFGNWLVYWLVRSNWFGWLDRTCGCDILCRLVLDLGRYGWLCWFVFFIFWLWFVGLVWELVGVLFSRWVRGLEILGFVVGWLLGYWLGW